jgi:hypothetical protein
MKLTLNYKLTDEAFRRLNTEAKVAKRQAVDVEVPVEEALARKVAWLDDGGGVNQWDTWIVTRCYFVTCAGQVQSGADDRVEYDHILSAEEALAEWRDMPRRSDEIARGMEVEAEAQRAENKERERRNAEVAAEVAAEREKEQAKKEAEESEALKERMDWIAQHGSARLKKACDLGMFEESESVYLDERLALEHPGWEFDSRSWEDSDILNPSEEALDELAEARKFDPEAKLLKQRRKKGDDGQWLETVEATVPWSSWHIVKHLD